jgi:hypothetical protein
MFHITKHGCPNFESKLSECNITFCSLETICCPHYTLIKDAEIGCCHILWYSAVFSVREPTFRTNGHLSIVAHVGYSHKPFNISATSIILRFLQNTAFLLWYTVQQFVMWIVACFPELYVPHHYCYSHTYRLLSLVPTQMCVRLLVFISTRNKTLEYGAYQASHMAWSSPPSANDHSTIIP